MLEVWGVLKRPAIFLSLTTLDLQTDTAYYRTILKISIVLLIFHLIIFYVDDIRDLY